MSWGPRVVTLSGGVGGARLADGLARVLPADQLTVIVNTGDDFRHYGLYVAPDIDTVLYTLSGRANPATGWGLAGDTDGVMRALRALGDDAWFHLGDVDLATHLVRTSALESGQTATAVTSRLAAALGVKPTILPATDDPLATLVQTEVGELDFQTWFVRQRCQPEATGVRFAGAEAARPTLQVLSALAAADVIVVGPSNPYLSLGPILAIPGLHAALREAPGVKVAVSPLIGGQAVKGPAADMLRRIAGSSGNLSVAEHYVDFLHGLVIDRADLADTEALSALGLAVHATDILVPNGPDRQRLAVEVLAFAQLLAARAAR
jgi:LPPG:FO 2-phospho-L-lactate transferase